MSLLETDLRAIDGINIDRSSTIAAMPCAFLVDIG